MHYLINTSMAGILLAMFAVLVFHIFLKIKQRSLRVASFLLFTGLCAIIVYWQNRSAVLGILVGVLYLLYHHQLYIALFIKKYKWQVLGVFSSLLILLSFYIKSASTAGRFFIYKISFLLLKKHWLWGVGAGQFNVAFNHEQAAYFANHSLNGTEGFLANDGYFAFNDWLQFFIEYGVLGGLASILFLLYFCWLFIQSPLAKVAIRLRGIIAMLVPVFIASFVSYPLHNCYVCFVSTIGIYASVYCIVQSSPLPVFSRVVIHAVFLSSIIFFGYMCCKHLKKQNDLYGIHSLWVDGQKNLAVNDITLLQATHKKDAAVAQTMAYYLYYTGKTKEAISILIENEKYNCNQQNHRQLGLWYQEINDSSQAIYHLHFSLYLTPHLIESRYHLMNFYIAYNNQEKAKEWASAILKYPIKIENPKAYLYKDSAFRFLNK